MPEIDIARKGIPPVAMPPAVRVIAIVPFLATAISFLTGGSLLFPEVACHRLWEWNRPAYALLSQEHLGTIAGGLLLALGDRDGDYRMGIAAWEAMGVVDRDCGVRGQWYGRSADDGCAAGCGERRFGRADCFAVSVLADEVWDAVFFPASCHIAQLSRLFAIDLARASLLHAAIRDVAGIASGDVGVLVRGSGGSAVRRRMGGSVVSGGVMHGSARHGGAWKAHLRHRERGGRSGGGGQCFFRKRLRMQHGCGENQGERGGEDDG